MKARVRNRIPYRLPELSDDNLLRFLNYVGGASYSKQHPYQNNDYNNWLLHG